MSADILDGLEELHSHGVVVLDLKPDNVLMTASGHAVLSDLGISRIVTRSAIVVRSHGGVLAVYWAVTPTQFC